MQSYNVAGWTGHNANYFSFDSGQITCKNENGGGYEIYLTSSKSYNFAGFTRFNIECALNLYVGSQYGTPRYYYFVLRLGGIEVARVTFSPNINISSVVFSFSNVGRTGVVQVAWKGNTYPHWAGGAIYRVWIT